MNDLRSLFKERSYIINPYVLKNIKSLNISLNEFLLIIYFLNEKPYLDLEKIKETLGFTTEEALNTYSELLSKGIIITNLNKEEGKVTEVVSLELFYDKLILNTKVNSKKDSDIFSKFESEFGRTLSPIEYETINNWLENNISENLILSALKEAVINGVSNLRYIEKIIYEWTKKGKNIDEDEEYEELFDCDWIEEMSNEK